MNFLTDKSRRYVYFVGSAGEYPSSRPGSKENRDPKVAASRHHRRTDQQSKDKTIKQQQEKIVELEKKYDSVIQKTRNDFASFQANMQKVQRVIEDKDETIISLKARVKQLTEECQSIQEDKDLIINELQNKLVSSTKQYEEMLRQTVAELKRVKETNQTLQEKQNKESDSERKLKERVRQLEQKNNSLLKEIYGDQTEMRMLRQQLQALTVLKDIEIASLKTEQKVSWADKVQQ